jgi:hypothetical protein
MQMIKSKELIPKGYRRIRMGEILPANYWVFSASHRPFYTNIIIDGNNYYEGKETGKRNDFKSLIRIVKK